jgi:hypothetical protein
MKTMVDLRTVDLTAYPDLVVIYLGMRERAVAGIKTLLGSAPKLTRQGCSGQTAYFTARITSSSNFIRCI